MWYQLPVWEQTVSRVKSQNPILTHLSRTYIKYFFKFANLKIEFTKYSVYIYIVYIFPSTYYILSRQIENSKNSIFEQKLEYILLMGIFTVSCSIWTINKTSCPEQQGQHMVRMGPVEQQNLHYPNIVSKNVDAFVTCCQHDLCQRHHY